jgi:hypothetical protein
VAVQSLEAQQLRLQFSLERVFKISFVEPETRAADDLVLMTTDLAPN